MWIHRSQFTMILKGIHTGGRMTLGEGAIQTKSTKLKVNTKSSTDAEWVSIDDIISNVLWTKLCLTSQRYEIKGHVIYHDNQIESRVEW